MSDYVDANTILFAPEFSVMCVPNGFVALDSQSPNWISSDERGLWLLKHCDGRTPFKQIVKDYAAQSGLDSTLAWLQVETFTRDALRQGFLSTNDTISNQYLGRKAYLNLDHLDELWVQVNDFCNLECEHCLVSSGPTLTQGLDTHLILNAIDQAVELGVQRVFFTGGEPLARPDIKRLCSHVIVNHRRELVMLTNGTLLKGDRLTELAGLSPSAQQVSSLDELNPGVRLQISLDGSTAEINDPIRGNGSYTRIVDGLAAAVSAGLQPTLTTTILRHNLDDLEQLIHLASNLGITNVHLLLPHRRGRIKQGQFSDLPSGDEILNKIRAAWKVACELNVSIDNIEEMRFRFDGTPGVKNDLSGAGWNSLCLYTDGWIYPSASMAGVTELRCGDLAKEPLQKIWKNSKLCNELRAATVEKKPICRSCSLKFLCGGGDLEHGYWAALEENSGQSGNFLAHDPYCELYKGLADDTFAEISKDGHRTVQQRSGFDRPVVLRGMGEHTLHDNPAEVRTTHSACVLSEEVIARSRFTVSAFYGRAAEEPKSELCCPVKPNADDLVHIPSEVIERFYGCGSPVSSASLVRGETMVDLGSGAGIDCFVAAKKVGREGHVYGIDMTDQMLAVARECQSKVAGSLGYDSVQFLKGHLENIPLIDQMADVVTSNCVINLSMDKGLVLREIWRILSNHGRTVISDIVSDRKVSPKVRADGQLWSECISGALTEEAFLSAFERAGFYGISILSKSFWREVQGCKFFSITVRGYKFEKSSGCEYRGQYAIYLGPQKAVIDEEGHLFPRSTPIEICTDTASKLSKVPYKAMFVVIDNPDDVRDVNKEENQECDPGCC